MSFDCSWSHVHNAQQASGEMIYDGKDVKGKYSFLKKVYFSFIITAYYTFFIRVFLQTCDHISCR